MQVRLTGKQNIFLEIAEEYKRFIRMGVIKNGEKLPSCRALGIELGINPNTVERAYSVLEAEGYIKTFPKKGVFVSYDEKEKESLLAEVAKHLLSFKNSGITYSEITKIIEQIYKEKMHDRD